MTKNSYAIKKIFGKIGRQPKISVLYRRRNTLKTTISEKIKIKRKNKECLASDPLEAFRLNKQIDCFAVA